MTIIITNAAEVAMLANGISLGYGLNEAGEMAIAQSLRQRAEADYARLCEKFNERDLTEAEQERLHNTALYLAGGSDA